MTSFSKKTGLPAPPPADRLQEMAEASPASVLADLQTSADGLTMAEAAKRLAEHGPNTLPEEHRSMLATLLSYFWGPIPWMIEVAAVLSAVVRHWDDLIVILVLLVFNGAVGFWQEHQAADAIEALRRQLALRALTRRDGQWQNVDAATLVVGDVIRIRLGNVVPADVKLLQGDYLSVDQSALTGESLPVDKKPGEIAYSGSTAKQGDMVAVVVATGAETYFGRTAGLVAQAHVASHFQRAVLNIGDYLIYLSLVLIAVLLAVQLGRGAPFLTLVQFALILTVAAIPVAMPAVLTVTMAVGALALAKMKAIVSRLESIEEMAGMDILCSDKTGTLTKNELTLGTPVLFEANEPREVVTIAALASDPTNPDAIDVAVLGGLKTATPSPATPSPAGVAIPSGGATPTGPETSNGATSSHLNVTPQPVEPGLEGYVRERVVPFDPVRKRTEVQVRGADGKRFLAVKGAPQVVLDLCQPDATFAARVNAHVGELARRGFRALGVARGQPTSTVAGDDGGLTTNDAAGRSTGEVGDQPPGSGREAALHFLGLLPLFDPPREDSAETIKRARDHGIAVKMVTGDDIAIAKETANQLGLGSDIQSADGLPTGQETAAWAAVGEQIEAADGFARVFPEHKFSIVKALQARGHIVGMTGDGVNDAPALKQADTGIAVSAATDAARAAADLVLTAPGLSVIVGAVEQARRIFQRMNSYAIYRITETIRVVVFVVAAMIIFNFYPITAILIILLALLNDVPIMTIAFDNTAVDPDPVRWDMRRVLSVSTVLGLIGVIETFGMLLIAKLWLKLDDSQIDTLIFLKLAIAGHLTLFVARARGPFLARPYPAPAVLWSAIGTKALATLLVAFGLGLITPIGWGAIGLVWAYCLVWVFVEDAAKLATYRHMDLAGSHHRRFVERLQQSLHPL